MTNDLKDSPVGSLVPTIDGQFAFVPDPLPRTVTVSPRLYQVLDRATIAIATLAGVGETLPNPHLLITPFIRREAVLSSRIEGTQASISDVFRFEAAAGRNQSADVREVVNYVSAVNHGLSRLRDLPICRRLADEMHSLLLSGVRGEDKRPGELRKEQNWIGNTDTPIQEARYIPPPHDRLLDLLADWERFVNEDSEMPVLVRCALMHYQFEAIHPYIDGNGRIGRALIILFLCQQAVLSTPLLYMSAYFEKHIEAYKDHLLDVSKTGNWDGWLEFFLRGAEEEARDALQRSRHIRNLQDRYRGSLQDTKASVNVLRLVDHLFMNPYLTIPFAADVLQLSYNGAQKIVGKLQDAGILEVDAGRWPRMYVARELLNTLEAQTV